MSREITTIRVVIAVALVILLWLWFSPGPKEHFVKPVVGDETAMTSVPHKKAQSIQNSLEQENKNPVDGKSESAKKNVWQEMEACFGSAFPGPENFQQVDSWTSALRGNLGEPVLQTEDWSETEIKTPAGEIRKIRIGMDYSNEDRVTRKLTYSKILESGAKEEIPLDPQFMNDPSETFLATLESDGQVVGKEKFQRIYFENGEEIQIRDKNGVVAEVEINKGTQQFRCNYANPDAKCTCDKVNQEPEPPSSPSMVFPASPENAPVEEGESSETL